MLLVIQTKAADGSDVFSSKRSKEKAYILISVQRAVDEDCLMNPCTAICSVTSCFPKISPLITRACLVLPVSVIPCGKIASP